MNAQFLKDRPGLSQLCVRGLTREGLCQAAQGRVGTSEQACPCARPPATKPYHHLSRRGLGASLGPARGEPPPPPPVSTDAVGQLWGQRSRQVRGREWTGRRRGGNGLGCWEGGGWGAMLTAAALTCAPSQPWRAGGGAARWGAWPAAARAPPRGYSPRPGTWASRLPAPRPSVRAPTHGREGGVAGVAAAAAAAGRGGPRGRPAAVRPHPRRSGAARPQGARSGSRLAAGAAGLGRGAGRGGACPELPAGGVAARPHALLSRPGSTGRWRRFRGDAGLEAASRELPARPARRQQQTGCLCPGGTPRVAGGASARDQATPTGSGDHGTLPTSRWSRQWGAAPAQGTGESGRLLPKGLGWAGPGPAARSPVDILNPLLDWG